MSPASPPRTLKRIESELMLLGWANLQFGFKSNKALFDKMKGTAEGYDPDGRSHVARTLVGHDQRIVPAGDLERYDDNVRRHLATINERRQDPITLRYFQQLAALYAELFLDRRAAAPEALAQEIDQYVRTRGHVATFAVRRFTPDDLNKLAFWMATGSGKTLIMHLNYLQFLHYGGADRVDNIILITPSEGLSAQHMKEMATSGIPSARFGETGLLAGHRRTVLRVTEITKLAEKKRGKGTGISIEVEALGDRNLVFVDEGHRGASGEAWRKVRDAVATRGFTFEYSATFGQALAAARDDKPHPRLRQVHPIRLFLPLLPRRRVRQGFPRTERHGGRSAARAHRPASPRQPALVPRTAACLPRERRGPAPLQPGTAALGLRGRQRSTRSTSGRGATRATCSSVQLFLHRVLSEPEWAKDAIGRLLQGESGLYSAWQVDLFAGRFDDLARSGGSPGQIYADLLDTFFHTGGPGGLRLCDIRGAPGELGLKAAGSDHYFGLTYIGDTAKFKKLALKADAGIIMEEDAVGGSMFGRVNEAGATVNVLIGAKKFVEGWNSWRVSNMGLMNVGRAEGSEIIQLFGRGVRLKGQRECRSSAARTSTARIRPMSASWRPSTSSPCAPTT